MKITNTIASIFLAGTLATSVAQTPVSTPSDSFLQEVQTEIKLPEAKAAEVLKLFQVGDTILAVSPNAIYRYAAGEWSVQTSDRPSLSAQLDAGGQLWLLTDDALQNEAATVFIKLPDPISGAMVRSLLWDQDTSYAGTTVGLYTFRDEGWSFVTETREKRINALAMAPKGILWAATDGGLLKRTPTEWQNLDDMLMAGGTEGRYFDLHIPPETEDLIFSAPYSVGCIAGDGGHWMWSGQDGLPYGPVTVIRSFGEVLWFGTDQGLARKDQEWRYYLGKRWLPHDQVNDILPIDERTVWIATPRGISQIQQVYMDLEAKAAHYEKIIAARHNRLGLINYSVLERPGDLTSSRTVNQDNDGLWTATYLAASCFRYAVTRSEAARENAVRTFEAVEKLETVTGIPGLPARSYARSSDAVTQSRSPHPKRWRPSPDQEWQWLDDCSSDEVVGHFFAISIFYDLVADREQKKRVEDLVRRTMDHIIENDFQLIDYDGKPTRWGIWQPDSINHSRNWAYEKGLYSLELLSFLKTAIHITGDRKYEKTYRHLIDQHHYAENAVQAKIYGPYENGFSDDILTFFPYYCLARYARDDPYWPYYRKSVERTWSVCRPDRMPTWNIIASVALQKDCDLDIAREELQLFPLDLIDWNMINSHRWDLTENQLVGRGGHRQASRPVPTPEARIFRWNTNPYQLDSGANGSREVSGTYFLLSYWMARYHGLL
ncbi:ligand-binding sensor domain-containing protein [Flavilitoribacter nigricans]|uniref:transcriptional regulator n=1 Tax=Flavilitoribacter nigricans TaxID=70997 RepID=UPI00162AF5F9|nr:transcriptional regulator [Flavilitoribacter nigricans]